MKRFVVLFALLMVLCNMGEVRADGEDSIALPIVMYHHISPRSRSWNEYVVSIDEFRSDMEYLYENGWDSISVKELLAWQRGEFDMPDKPMMISFDDGFSSVAEYAEPIMKEYGFVGVAAIIGSVCERYSESGEYDPEWSDLSWEAAAEMAERGVLEVQCHTWDLHSMDNVLGCAKRYGESLGAYRRRLSTDLSKFLSACERNDVGITYTIAYPFGAYDENTTDIVRDMGFEAAFTCTEKINILTGDADELYDLGRFNRPHGISSEKFFKKWENNA